MKQKKSKSKECTKNLNTKNKRNTYFVQQQLSKPFPNKQFNNEEVNLKEHKRKKQFKVWNGRTEKKRTDRVNLFLYFIDFHKFDYRIKWIERK